jgi:hypothetical protein
MISCRRLLLNNLLGLVQVREMMRWSWRAPPGIRKFSLQSSDFFFSLQGDVSAIRSAFLSPGSGMVKKIRSEIRDKHFLSYCTIFWVKNNYIQSCVSGISCLFDPGGRDGKIRIRDPGNHTGSATLFSAINISEPFFGDKKVNYFSCGSQEFKLYLQRFLI